MKYLSIIGLGLLSASFGLLACSASKSADNTERADSTSAESKETNDESNEAVEEGNKPAPMVNDERFHAKLNEIVGEYQEYGVSGSRYVMIPRCAVFTPGSLESQSNAGEHAKKDALFFAKDSIRYNLGSVVKFTSMQEIEEPKDVGGDVAPRQEVGQTIVKEALARNDEGHTSTHSSRDPGRLFIMTKLDPKTEGTDKGWVYGIVEPDKTISASGVIKSCQGCHRGAKYDRLFGLRNAIQAHIDKK